MHTGEGGCLGVTDSHRKGGAEQESVRGAGAFKYVPLVCIFMIPLELSGSGRDLTCGGGAGTDFDSCRGEKPILSALGLERSSGRGRRANLRLFFLSFVQPGNPKSKLSGTAVLTNSLS